jgi:hypothetical protein
MGDMHVACVGENFVENVGENSLKIGGSESIGVWGCRSGRGNWDCNVGVVVEWVYS